MHEPVGVTRRLAAAAAAAVLVSGGAPVVAQEGAPVAGPFTAPAAVVAQQEKPVLPPPGVAVNVGGLAQVDGHLFLDPGDSKVVDDLLIRRARLDLRARLGRFSARVAPELGGGKAVVMDAYVDAKLPAGLSVRVGKFAPPISAERLQPSAATSFVETALSSNLAPTRDVGVQLSGGVAGIATFAAGVFDGAPDAAAMDGDVSGDKDLAGRIVVKPFAPLGIHLLADLGLGVSGSWGASRGDPTKLTELPTYKSDGLATVFEFRKWSPGAAYDQPSAANTAWSSGRRTRLGVQGSWSAGPAAVAAEYLVSEQRVLFGVAPAQVARLRNTGWQVVAVYNLTGERATDGVVVPAASVDAGGWGALQVAARVASLDLDDDAFPTFARAERSVSGATSVGAGISWWPTGGARLVVDYVQTSFDGGDGTASAIEDRRTERVALARAQIAF